MKLPLKNHSLSEIEETIAKALKDLCGHSVEVDISSFEVHEDITGWRATLAIAMRNTPPDTSSEPF